jgi:hypothetical protein
MNKSEVEKGFEWRLEEEEWPEARPGPLAKRAPRRISRWWVALALALLGLIGVAGLLGQWQWQKRQATVIEAATADLPVAYNLVLQAIARRDSELFSTLLHGANDRWYSVQNGLMRAELLLDRPALALWVDWDAFHAAGGDSLPEMHLSADSYRAEVVMVLPYLVQTREGETATVPLQQTFFYERSGADGRWLLAPAPDDTFRREWIADRQERLSLIYSGRDEAVGRRLAVDLDTLLARLCHDAAVTCPPYTLFQIRLDGDPQSLMLLAENYRQVNLRVNPNQLNLRLPAPSLVGLPVDEAGYEALYRGYAAWVAAVLVHDAGRQAVTAPEVTSLLVALDLRPPPAAGFYPLVGQRPPPVPFPKQELQLLCNWFEGGSIWRYRPLTDTWQPEWTPANDHGLRFMRDEAAMEALPGGQGVLLYGRQAVDGIPRWRAYLWRDGEAQLLLDEAEAHFPLTIHWLPAPVAADERFVLFVPPEGADYLPYGPVRAVDLGRCSAAGCQVWEFDGFPSWSPDGRLVAVNSAAGSWPKLHLVAPESSSESVPLGAGYSPFWWDSERLGFIRPSFTRGQPAPDRTELVVARLAAATSNAWQEEAWLDAAELRAALPAGYDAVAHSLFISGAAPYPGRPAWLFITAAMVRSDGSHHASFLYAFQPATGAIRYLMPAISVGPLRISPHGRYLASADAGTLWIYAFDEETRHMLYRYGATDVSWSADEQWLALAEEGQIRLVAIEHDFQRIVPHDFRGCSRLEWVGE